MSHCCAAAAIAMPAPLLMLLAYAALFDMLFAATP